MSEKVYGCVRMNEVLADNIYILNDTSDLSRSR